MIKKVIPLFVMIFILQISIVFAQILNETQQKEVDKYLEIKGKDYVIQTIKFVNNQEGIKNYGGYLIKSLQEGWAEGSLELKSGSVLEYAESLKQKIKQKINPTEQVGRV